jgi:DNA-binding response OmpR family regulator
MPNSSPFPKIVLVVEDEPAIYQLIKIQLESEGYAVTGEMTGAGAIDRIKKSKIFIVLLDLGLPDMSGFEVLRQIRVIKPDLQVIVVTGHHEESEGRQAFNLGALDYVTKPIDFVYLKNILLMQSMG